MELKSSHRKMAEQKQETELEEIKAELQEIREQISEIKSIIKNHRHDGHGFAQ